MALPLFEQALAMRQRLDSPDTHASATALAHRLVQQGQWKRAAEAAEVGIRAIERARQQLGGTDQDRVRFLSNTVKYHGDPFALMAWVQVRLNRPDLAVTYLERGRGLSLRDVLERGRRLAGRDLLGAAEAEARARSDDRTLAEVARIRTRLQQVPRKLAEAQARERYLRGLMHRAAEHNRELKRLIWRRRALEEALLSARREMFALVGELGVPDIKPAKLADMQGILSGKQRLLIYSLASFWSVGSEDSLVLVVGPRGTAVQAHKLTWPDGKAVRRETLDQAVGRYLGWIHRSGRRASRTTEDARGVIRRPGPTTQPQAGPRAGHRLFQALVPAAIRANWQEADCWWVVPDGAMVHLPLESLIVQAPKAGAEAETLTYWLDRGPMVVYGSSGTVLVNRVKARDAQLRRLSQGKGPPRPATLLGDPIFTRSKGEPRTGREPLPSQGVLVVSVSRGSNAEKAGLVPGDVLTHYDGKPVADYRALAKRINGAAAAIEDGKRQAGDVAVRLWREGKVLRRRVPPGRVGAHIAKKPLASAWEAWQASRADIVPAAARSSYRTRYGGLSALPGTRREVEIIAGALGKRHDRARYAKPLVKLLGEEATRAKLYAAASGSRYLHLATHGLTDQAGRAIYTSLALTCPRVITSQDFGFLTLMDLFNDWSKRLEATELVVLSACETHRGPEAFGEGVFGLSWGFMYAGSPSVIASLWRVSDVSTCELMSEYYRRLAAREPGAATDASKGKLALLVAARKALKKKFPGPYHWAAFIYLGDPR